MKLLLISLTLLAVAHGTAFSLLNRCACSNYSLSAICSAVGYCSWIKEACVDLQCSTVTSTKCTGSDTDYKCSWNSSSNTCESKTYSCSDFTSDDSCGVNYGFDCVWQTSTSKCIDFTCTGIDSKNCDFYRCSYVNGLCGSPQPVDCSTQTTTSCVNNRPGSGTACALNDSNVCKSYNIFPKNCSDYSDYKVYCNVMCTYDSTTKTCRSRQCSDYNSKTDCTYVGNYYYFTFTPCFWSGTACSEATDANIQTFDVVSCLGYTAIHYKWDVTVSKCVQCTSFSDYNLVSTMNNVIHGGSSKGQILLVVILFMLLLD